MDISGQQKQEIRWVALRVVENYRQSAHNPTCLGLIQRVTGDTCAGVIGSQVLTELDWLIKSELIEQVNDEPPMYEMTIKGINVYEGVIEPPVGMGASVNRVDR